METRYISVEKLKRTLDYWEALKIIDASTISLINELIENQSVNSKEYVSEAVISSEHLVQAPGYRDFVVKELYKKMGENLYNVYDMFLVQSRNMIDMSKMKYPGYITDEHGIDDEKYGIAERVKLKIKILEER